MAHASDHEERWQEVLEEHRELQAHLRLLSDCVVGRAPRGSDWGAELSRRASLLMNDLEKHFAGEAEEKFFREVELRTPHLAHKVGNLRKEHREIMMELRHVAGDAPASSGKAAERIAARVRAVIALINRHEAEETELLFRSIYEDMGVGD